MRRTTAVVRGVLALCVAASALALDVSGARSRGDDSPFAYPFSCTWASLTADFAERDALPQTVDPVPDWYRTDAAGQYVNHGWGPRPEALAPPAIPQGTNCEPMTWRRERILAVAMRYIDTPGNPLGLQYRHHHIPAWNPPTSTYAGAPPENPDPDAAPASTAWDAGAGLDCSNFTAWVYNYGLGVGFSGDVGRQWDGTAGPMGRRIPANDPFQPGDLVFLHPNGDSSRASHVVIYVDDAHIVDSRVSAQNRVGVQVRDRRGWYREAVLGAWRPAG